MILQSISDLKRTPKMNIAKFSYVTSGFGTKNPKSYEKEIFIRDADLDLNSRGDSMSQP